jgi:asparagine synthase (glutamine-hydrolysing)
MSRDYFLLVDSADRPDGQPAADPATTLQNGGMRLRATFGATRVFASRDTSTLLLPGGGVIVGELYSHSGECIRNVNPVAGLPSDTAVRHHVLANFWGDYVLVLPGTEDPSTLSVTRSPSHTCDLPCFYSLSHGTGFLTSDITIAMRLGLYRRRVDFGYLAHRLIYPDLKTCRTGMAEVSELLPGCTLQLRHAAVHVGQAWSPWDFVDTDDRYTDAHEAAAAIRHAVVSVIRAWAERDECVLLELSGGLDSSIVGAGLEQSQARVTCCTLTTPVPGADEREYGALIASMLGVELQSVELGYDEALFEFPIAQALVTPAIGPLQYAVDRIMQTTAERCGAKSYFSGAGGDTIFGYLTSAAPAADAFREDGFSTGIRAIRDLSMFHQCTYWKAGRLTLRKLLQPQRSPYGVDRSWLSPRLHLPEAELHPWLSPPARALPGDRQRIFELSATQFFRDSCPRSLSRPVRMPLLSQPVIEACLRVPSWMWFAGGHNRAVARQAFADVLPPAIVARKSKGTFTAYLGALYRRKAGAMLAFLLDGELQSHDLLDVDALRQLAGGEVPRGTGAFMRIFQLCALENWARQQSPSAERAPTSTAR